MYVLKPRRIAELARDTYEDKLRNFLTTQPLPIRIRKRPRPKMTGITDALANAKATIGMLSSKTAVEECRDIPKPTTACGHRAELARPMKVPKIERNLQWGLLFPITSAGVKGAAGCWKMLTRFGDSLFKTTTSEDRKCIDLYVGIDDGDRVYDNDAARKRLRRHFRGVRVHITMLHAGFRGNVCTIWNLLAQKAVADGAHYLVLLGDDVVLEAPGWKSEIENRMSAVAKRAGLPEGLACVAFRDLTMPGFPCFPVVHRTHVAIFGNVLPPEFVNQGGDPFLFALYRRYGAAEFAPTASLRNTVGGGQEARYQKTSLSAQFSDKILARELGIFARELKREVTHVCLDVVVPTYRCDATILRRICSQTSDRKGVSLEFIVVVDRPSAPNLGEVRRLLDWTPNRVVRVWVHSENKGASLARNTGLAQSLADYIVLLDDDVIPDPELLDAYLGAVDRYPEARIFVGNTRFPKAKTVLERAMRLSEISYFYGIAKKMTYPPWGVTANMCVRGPGRTIWFDPRYPRTGGGEDVDFCLRTRQRHGNASIVAVPFAGATHPYWPDPICQVWGWAKGDALCLDSLPHATFYRFPNWIESIITLALVGAVSGVWIAHDLLAMSLVLFFTHYAFSVAEALPRLDRAGGWREVVAVILAPLPSVVQDVARLSWKLQTGRLHQLCLGMDWMDGQDGRQWLQACRMAHLVRLAVGTSTIAMLYAGMVALPCALVLLAWATYWFWQTPHRVCLWNRLLRLHLPQLSAHSPQKTKFVVLGWQRTGSNWLCGMLHNHHQIRMHNEVFQSREILSYNNALVVEKGWSVADRDRDPAAFVRDLFSATETWHNAVGFKLFPEHFRNPVAIAKLLTDPSIKIILLHRRDAVAVYVSQRRAHVTGQFLRADAKARISINAAEMQAYLRAFECCYRAYDRILESSPRTILRVDYEDLVSDLRGQWARIVSYLRVSTDVEPKALRETRKLPRAVITNLEALREAFKHTRHRDSAIWQASSQARGE